MDSAGGAEAPKAPPPPKSAVSDMQHYQTYPPHLNSLQGPHLHSMQGPRTHISF